MSLEKTLLLGFIAGVTILLGLPIGRMKRPAPTLRMMLNAIAVGILVFLVWDVLSAAWEPIDGALTDFHAGDGGLGSAFGYGAALRAGLAVGLLSLVAYERWMERIAHDSDAPPVAMAALEPRSSADPAPARWRSGATANRTCGLVARASSRSDRGRHRAAQLRRRTRDRPGRRVERDRAGDAARHRLRVAQRDRRLRHRRAADGRDRRRRHRAHPELGPAPAARRDRRRADVHRHRGRARVHLGVGLGAVPVARGRFDPVTS